jgi:hypothetical protein
VELFLPFPSAFWDAQGKFSFFLDFLTIEDGMDSLSRNVDKLLPLGAA